MENYVRVELGLPVDEDEEPDVMEDLPLFHPLPYVLSTWAAGHKHGQQPEIGGINDQSAAWGHDKGQMNRLYNITFARLLPELETSYGRQGRQTEDTDTGGAWGWEDIADGERE